MGVPKFYRWISERYPKINQVITDTALLPEFDHLYLDMNGIIHGCTHPNHLDVSDVLSERDMMLGIMHYLDRIVTQIVKPQVSVYMAIDGVAPRAKLNQQRSRRFRSAKDLAEATKDNTAITFLNGEETGGATGGDHQQQGAFDSNCITPGTEFMARVSNTIKYFIRKKIKEDPLWRNLKVIFSGHEVPGEGEHKIMQHIRDMRNQPGYQPNTRHCMYGQDADLIMLGLVSHEPHFTLLREIVDFSGGFNNNKNTLKTVQKFTKESDFQLLHLSVLREYLQMEFVYGLDATTYDLESIIDDFVFMTFLVGNDFLPHMPSLDIGDGAFDLLFNTYKDQRPGWGEGQYLTHAGEISDAARLELFIEVIGAAETEILENREDNEAAYLKKKRKWDKRDGKAEGPSDKELKAMEESKHNDYMSVIEDIVAKQANGDTIEFVDGWKPVTEAGQKDFKGRYYFEKLHFSPVDIQKHHDLRKAYIEGLIWCLAYYYKGCISWGWYYPYHYGPMLSDLRNLPAVFDSIKFDIGAPLKPFEQLMGCLPPASGALVPRPYRKLMMSPDSPIIDFYPETFEVDMNGKRNPWEGVNILSFIDVNLLKETVATQCPDKVLTPDERSRNSLGKVLCYTFDLTNNDTVPSCNKDIGLIDISKCHSRVDVFEEPERDGVSFKPELMPGTQIPYPGFPSLNVLPIENVELIGVGLNVFGHPSKYETTVLTLHKLPPLPGAEQLADNVLGKSLFINWPMMHEGKVVAVSDATCEVRMVKKKKKVRKFKELEADRWQADSEVMKTQYLNGSGIPGSGGVNIGDIQIRFTLVPLQGMKTSPVDGSSKKVFGKEEADVPLQMVLMTAPAPDPRFYEKGAQTVMERFPPTTNVILTKGKHRGCVGTVVGTADSDKVSVTVTVVPPEPPFGLAIARSVQESYISSSDAAKVLNIHPGIFGKITGSLHFDPGRYDLGLNLKYKHDLSVLGYTRRRNKPVSGNNSNPAGAWVMGDSVLVVGSKRSTPGNSSDDDNKEKIYWEYTPKAIRLVAAYRQTFPQLFSAITKYPNERFYEAKKVFGSNGEEMLPKVREWLNNIETAKMPRMPGSTDAMPIAAVAAVQRAADVRLAAQEQAGGLTDIKIKVPPSALYREGSTAATDVILASDNNQKVAPELGDRVANLCANGIIFGARGTVVSIHDPTSGCVEVVMDEEFIGGSTLQGTCGNFRGKLCVWAHLLKISASDSKGMVDKIMPVGSGKKAVVDELTAETKNLSIDEKKMEEPAPVVKSSKATRTDEKPAPKSFKDAAKTPSAAPKSFKDAALVPPVNENRNKTPVTQRSNTPSKRGGKQGAWKEAMGPDKVGIGFSSAGRGYKSGLKAWRSLTLGKAEKGTPKRTKQTPSTTEKGTPKKPASSTSDGLKAMLGVSGNGSSSAPPVVPPTPDPSAGLKSILGVGAPSPSGMHPQQMATPPPQQTHRPANAADALMALMMNSPPPPQAYPPMPMQQQPSKAAFNFTYVKAGEEPPTPPPSQRSQQPQSVPYYHGPPPGGPNMPMYPYPHAPHPGMGMPQIPGGGIPVGYGAPPGGIMTPGPSPAKGAGSGVVKREKKSTKGVKANEASMMVPSAILSKNKK